MKTSNQLTKQYSCSNNNGATMTSRADHIVAAQAQKEVMRMALDEEIPKEIDSIKSALKEALLARDVVFENRHQEEESINTWTRRIYRYVTWEMRDLIYPEKENPDDRDTNLMLPDEDGNYRNTNTPVFGEEIKVIPDYMTRNGNVTTIGKIKTGRIPNDKIGYTQENEVYAYGLLGKKLYPNDRIEVEIVNLADISAKAERALINLPFMPNEVEATQALHADRAGAYKEKISTIPFTEALENDFIERHEKEMESDEITVDDKCASCPKFNVCNYVEPPMAMPADVAVRPINEIYLTDEQREAVDYRHGTVVVNAGAGAGKTLTVSWRVKEMLKEGIAPEKIVLVTFTNAGADEMKARVLNYCEADGVEIDHEKLTMTTFNALCQTIIEDHYEELGYTRPPKVIPEEIKMDRINQIISRYPRISKFNYGASSQWDPNRALSSIKKYFNVIKENRYTRDNIPWEAGKKTWDSDLNGYVDLSETDLDNIFQMYNDYQNMLKTENRLEFADQIQLVEKLLEIRPALFDEIGWSHIIVDEFQDTDLPQIKLLQKMKDAASFESLMCVGDDSQAIFSFRHTSPEYIINFDKYLGDGNDEVGYHADHIALIENHRSSADIIDFANKINTLNENRVDKDLIATKGYDKPVDARGYYSYNKEYKDVAKMIKEQIDSGVKPYDIAFLAYTKKELQAVASELTKLNVPSIMMVPIPYTDNSNCAAAETFFDSYAYRTTQGMMDYINAKEHGSLVNASANITNQKVLDFANELENQPVTRDGFIEYIKGLDPDEQDECLQDFIKQKLEPCESMEELKDLFRTMKLYGKESLFKRQGRYDGVCLSTIHSAKGLEWDKVYYSVDKLDKESFHKTFRTGITEKDELNRMHFVAASRAKSECVCVGRYTLSDVATRDMYPNAALKAAFEFINKPFVYQNSMVTEVKRQERQEAQRAAQEQEVENLRRVHRIREMTPEERERYERIVEGAEQLTLDDIEIEQ